jgi:hypothetical protein
MHILMNYISKYLLLLHKNFSPLKFSILQLWLVMTGTALLTACSVTDSSSASNAALNQVASNTAGVWCEYSHNELNASPNVNAVSMAQWKCNNGIRTLVANGIPDHAIGVFPNPGNQETMSVQRIQFSTSLHPQATNNITRKGGPRVTTGYLLNGIKIDPGTAGTCDDAGANCPMGPSFGRWNIEAMGQTSFNYGTDENNAHVQPNGTYHYHGIPDAFVNKLNKGKIKTMTLIGWAGDGFPIYARYGYQDANDAASEIKAVTTSYRIKLKPDSNRPATTLFPMGTFTQDYEYLAGSGDLDECNGRTGVTPEFPKGIYHYFATDTYPYLQRCMKGKF